MQPPVKLSVPDNPCCRGFVIRDILFRTDYAIAKSARALQLGLLKTTTKIKKPGIYSKPFYYYTLLQRRELLARASKGIIWFIHLIEIVNRAGHWQP